MAIEGPLRELGIHDVFQLLDLSRKTGRLRITSALRGNEGTVLFHNGRVVGASMRDNPHQLGQMLLRSGRITESEFLRAQAIRDRAGEPRRVGDILVAIGAVSQRELERQLRRQIEAVVFELMSWNEGFFSFEEGETDVDAVDPEAGLSAESLLMEAARRIDEWARIADRIPGPEVVPALAESDLEHQPALDLRPHEWEVLAAIDGTSDLRAIAIAAGVSEFDAARIVYGLLSTGVVRLVPVPSRTLASPDDAVLLVSDAREALRDGRLSQALAAVERVLASAPGIAEAHAIAGESLAGLERLDEADAQFRRALELEPGTVPWLMTAARVAIKRGDLVRAQGCWRTVQQADPHSLEGRQAREALHQAARLNAMAEVGHDR